jgi:hypothetical protein
VPVPVAPTSPPCHICGRPLESEVVRALGSLFHPQCFRCSRCDSQLRGDTFALGPNDKPLCRACRDIVQRAGRPTCAACGQLIEDDTAVVAADLRFHCNCFRCAGECGRPLEGEYLRRDNRFFCREDYTRLFAMRCAVCSEPITDRFLELAPDRRYHPSCLRCGLCSRELAGSSFFKDSDTGQWRCPSCLSVR